MMFTLEEIKKAVKGALLPVNGSVNHYRKLNSKVKIKGVFIDSRTLGKGCLFIAIKGARLDGHDFISQAIERGASVIIVSKNMSCHKDVVVFRVKDTTKALGQIAALHRARFNIPVIAVTGSTGKTTTKDMIATVLETGARFNVLKNIGTENNQYGVPLTLLKLKKHHGIVVLELGTNHPGDIAWLSKIARPTAAVFTNVGESHLEGLESSAGVFREKIQLLKYMLPGGQVIFNNDDLYLKRLGIKAATHKKITYAIENKADYRASEIVIKNNSSIHFKVRGRTFFLKTPAEHNVRNALAAICCGLLYKNNYADIGKSLARFRFCHGRQKIKRVGQVHLIDDTYNSNPVSFRSAVQTLDSLNTRGRKILVCADMLELGRQAVKLHQLMGKIVASSSIDCVITIGEYSKYIAQEVERTGQGIIAVHCRSFMDVHKCLKNLCGPGDIFLVKGSRGMHMEKTVEFLEQEMKS